MLPPKRRGDAQKYNHMLRWWFDKMIFVAPSPFFFRIFTILRGIANRGEYVRNA